MPGVDTLKLREAALALARGGVGYSPHSDFIHLDIGPRSAVVFRLPCRPHCQGLTWIRIARRKNFL